MTGKGLIPKEDQSGATRTLGMSGFEDKIVQKMMQKILESIYEPIVMGSDQEEDVMRP